MQSVIGYNNYVLSSSITAVSSAAGLSVSNLQDETGSPAAAWQTASGVTTPAAGALFQVSPNIAGQTWRVFGIFRTNLTQAAQVTVQLFRNAVLVYSWTGLGPYPGYGQVIHIAPADQIADFARISIDDHTNTDGFINVPLAFAGPAWLPLSAPSWETTLGSDLAADETTTRGGQEFSSLLWFRRRMELALAGIRENEVLTGWAPLDRAARNANNILFVPDAESDTLYQQAIYGRLKPTADVGYPYGAADRRSWRASITERL